MEILAVILARQVTDLQVAVTAVPLQLPASVWALSLPVANLIVVRRFLLLTAYFSQRNVTGGLYRVPDKLLDRLLK